MVVAHPPEVTWIAEARVKTDPQDVIRLAHLLAANLDKGVMSNAGVEIMSASRLAPCADTAFGLERALHAEENAAAIVRGFAAAFPGFHSQIGIPRGRAQEMRNILANDLREVGDDVPGANEMRALSSVREKLAAAIEAIWRNERGAGGTS